MQFSPSALLALTEAVAQLAGSQGTLEDRLRGAELGLMRVRPIDLDADSWRDLVAIRRVSAHGGTAAKLKWAAEELVALLVCYGTRQPHKFSAPG
jgi:hypothetical protein